MVKAKEGKLEKEIKKHAAKILRQKLKEFGIEFDYVVMKIVKENPSYEVAIRISKDKKPVDNIKFISEILYRISTEVGGVGCVTYDLIHNRGKYQKLHCS